MGTVTLLDTRHGRSVPSAMGTPMPMGDVKMVLHALSFASDVKGPLAWLDTMDLGAEADRVHSDAAPHALQENLKMRLALDNKALENGQLEAHTAFDLAAQVQTHPLGHTVLNPALAHDAFFECHEAWLAGQARTADPLLDMLADHIADANDYNEFARRLARGVIAASRLPDGAETLERVATARRGQTLLTLGQAATKKAEAEGLFYDFSDTYHHWLAGSGLTSPQTSGVLALQVLETWVSRSQAARKGSCGADCRKCPVGEQREETSCATIPHIHTR